MIIRDFSLKIGDIGEESDRRAIGILNAKRTIYVFVDKVSYEAKSFKTAKAAIINECVYDNKFDFTHYIKRDNAYIIRKGLYFGTIICGVPGDIQSEGSFFSLDSAISSEKNVQQGNDEVISYGSNIFSTRMHNLDNNDMLCLDVEYEVNSIPPQYYNEYMMFKDLGDWTDLASDPYSCKVDTKILIDHSTTFQFMDAEKYDTMRLELRGSIINIESVYHNSISIPTNIGSAFNSYEGKGTIFVYDSDAFGIGKDGVNFRGGYIPQGKFYNKSWVARNLGDALEMFRSNCKDIEEEYGHIRVLYNPDDLGNKFKFKFKDYKTSPLVPLGKVLNNGFVDETKSDNVTSGIDSGYILDRSMQDSIELVNKSNARDLLYKTQSGWGE